MPANLQTLLTSNALGVSRHSVLASTAGSLLTGGWPFLALVVLLCVVVLPIVRFGLLTDPRGLDAGFVDTFRLFTQGNGHYSWWSNFANSRARNVGWRIDYLMVSAALRDAVKSAQIHAGVMGSDHCPVSIALDSSF